MASRRKRGPVAFRPRLLAGLAFRVTDVLGGTVLLWNRVVTLQCYTENAYGITNFRFGSLAAPQDSTIPAAAIGSKADPQ
jgi:hypothetical protein